MSWFHLAQDLDRAKNTDLMHISLHPNVMLRFERYDFFREDIFFNRPYNVMFLGSDMPAIKLSYTSYAQSIKSSKIGSKTFFSRSLGYRKLYLLHIPSSFADIFSINVLITIQTELLFPILIAVPIP